MRALILRVSITIMMAAFGFSCQFERFLTQAAIILSIGDVLLAPHHHSYEGLSTSSFRNFTTRPILHRFSRELDECKPTDSFNVPCVLF